MTKKSTNKQILQKAVKSIELQERQKFEETVLSDKNEICDIDIAIDNFAKNPPPGLEAMLKKAEDSIQNYIDRGLI